MAKTVVISGATRGLGLALAEQFAENDWFVYGCGTNAKAVEDVQQQFGGCGRFAVVDVTDARQVAAWGESLASPPKMVIANAGVIHAPQPVWELPEQDFRHNMEVNVLGVYHMLCTFIPQLSPAGGLFIGMSSSWGREAAAGMSAYCASKFAVEGLLKSAALDAPASVRIFPLDPGDGVDTDMLKLCLPEQAGLYPTPEEWAEAAYRYLQSGLQTIASGASLTVPVGNS